MRAWWRQAGISQRAAAGLLPLLVVLLFVGGPDGEWGRSARQAWQFGHVVLFFLLGWLLLPELRCRYPERTAIIAVLLGAAALGLLIEWLQGFVGREVSFADVRLDVIGAALALPWRRGAVPAHPRGGRPLGAGLIAAAAGLALLWLDVRPLLGSVRDEYRARRDFPLLASWASERELGRLSANGHLQIVEAPGRPGERALSIRLRPGRYAGFQFDYFPPDWRGFRALQLELHLPPGVPGSVTCRIHDRSHDNRYADRFNRRFPVLPGWNTLRLPLAEVQAAPRGRPMDMAHLTGLGCFFVGLEQPVALGLGTVRLLQGGSE